MSRPPDLSLEGFSVRTLLGRRTYRWEWIYGYWPWPRNLELLLDAPDLGKWGAVPAIYKDHVPDLIRHPSFPRWLFNPRRAMQYGLSATEARAYGPSSDTRWTQGGVPDAAGLNKRLARTSDPMGFEFTLYVDRVGSFREGAAFASQDDVRVVPWTHLGVDPCVDWKDLGIDSDPAKGGCVRFQIGRKLVFGGDQFFVTLAQARAILNVPEARGIAVAPELARAIGVPPRGEPQRSPPR
ncbi:MAG: hypothetical protein KGJ23_15990 [Euryarchaeota archaeon]|nr:hypothetical protein [Euryarchaeota archaeon]MDE1838100.1 hypothetical protein [Euryarchaeota archaeon]MDE2046595.1 hypothetical protein [Thermoplasmata archaeon]